MTPATKKKTFGGLFDRLLHIAPDVADTLDLVFGVDVIELQGFEALVVSAYRASGPVGSLQLPGDSSASAPVSVHHLFLGTGSQEIMDARGTARDCFGDGFIAHASRSECFNLVAENSHKCHKEYLDTNPPVNGILLLCVPPLDNAKKYPNVRDFNHINTMTIASNPTIQDLLNLLDDHTLERLSQRLHQVFKDSTDSDKAQLLFEYIEAGVAAEEEYETCPDRLVMVQAVLNQLNP
jgi:hypothetical protein